MSTLGSSVINGNGHGNGQIKNKKNAVFSGNGNNGSSASSAISGCANGGGKSSLISHSYENVKDNEKGRDNKNG